MNNSSTPYFPSPHNPMAVPPRKTGSYVDKFSFPIPPITTAAKTEYSDQFEFGCVTTTPGSPNSPADHLFFNGKLLPHVFPTNNYNFSYSLSISRTSSISSKDSLMSSRSNSTNSRSSNCSSARTSTSDRACDRKRLALKSASDGNIPGRRSVGKERKSNTFQYGPSQGWQFIGGAPVLKHQVSRSRHVEKSSIRGGVDGKGPSKNEGRGGKKWWFGRRFFKSLVSTCKECHAINTSTTDAVLP